MLYKNKKYFNKIIIRKKIDIGFLADDDVLYKPNCLNRYVN